MTTSACPFTALLEKPGDFAPGVAAPARDEVEQEALGEIRAQVRRYCSKHVDGAAIDARGAIGEEILGAVRDLGWFGLTVPEAHGGAGLSLKAATRVVAELAGFNGSLGTCVGLHSGLGLYSLVHLGAAELHERYLPEIAAGERITAFAATEPSAGSDLTAMRTVLSEQDGKLLLNGSKCYVTNGGLCGIITVVARSPGLGGARAGHTMVAVDPTWSGVTRQGEEKKLGLKGSSTITIDFDDVVIPPDHVVGEMSKGMEQAHRALTWGRTFMAAGCLGAAEAALAEARAHTAERVQFGRPLADFALVREQTAGALADTYASETVIRLVCDLDDVHGADIGLPSAVAKVYGSEASWYGVDRALQLMGGTGYIEEAGVARRLRDVRVTRIFEGANDVLRLHLGSAVLGWPADELTALGKLAPHAPEQLGDAARAFDEVMEQLAARLVHIRSKYAFRLYAQQALQSKMADGIIAAYAMLAVLLRALGSVRSGSATDRELSLALLAAKRLEAQARQALQLMDAPDDPALPGLIEGVLSE